MNKFYKKLVWLRISRLIIQDTPGLHATKTKIHVYGVQTDKVRSNSPLGLFLPG